MRNRKVRQESYRTGKGVGVRVRGMVYLRQCLFYIIFAVYTRYSTMNQIEMKGSKKMG